MGLVPEGNITLDHSEITSGQRFWSGMDGGKKSWLRASWHPMILQPMGWVFRMRGGSISHYAYRREEA